MKIRICSDLHVDVNGAYEFGFNKLNDVDLLIIAGDIGGSYQCEKAPPLPTTIQLYSKKTTQSTS